MTTSLATLIVLAFALAYAAYGAILLYHWMRYGASVLLVIFSASTYTIIGLYLLAVAASAAFAI